MSASVSFADVCRMLDHCAPGSEVTLRTHFRFVKYNSLVFPTLPKHDMIELGHIRKMCRSLGIYKCAMEFLGVK